jgi:fucose 4-O-acetylase-like acetyltransferase
VAERKLHIDIARGIAIIWVVYGHAVYQLAGTSFFAEKLQIHSDFIYSFFAFRMPILFMISGAFQRRRLEYTFSSHRKYLNKITKSIFIPFYSLSLVFLLINTALRPYVNAPAMPDMIRAMLYIQSNRDILPSGVLWFLFTLFAVSVLTWLAIRVLKVKPIHLLIFSLLFKIAGTIWLQRYEYLAVNTISEFMFFFVLGYVFDKRIFFEPLHKWKDLGVIFCCYLAFIYFLFIPEQLPSSLQPVFDFLIEFGILGLFGSLLILGMAYDLAQHFSRSETLRFLMYCGASSMLIYVFHMPTFTLIRLVSKTFGFDPGYARLIFTFIPGVLLPIVYGKFLSANTFVYKMLIGRPPSSPLRIANLIPRQQRVSVG